MMIQKSIRTTLAALAVFSLCTTTVQAGTAHRVTKAVLHAAMTGGGVFFLKKFLSEETRQSLGFSMEGAEYVMYLIMGGGSVYYGATGLVRDLTEEDDEDEAVSEAAFDDAR